MNFLEDVGILVAGLAAFAVWPNMVGRRSMATTDVVQDIPCSLNQTRASRSNRVTVTVAIPCDERFEFTLRPERSTDRFAKALHLTREFQTEDESFDEAVYIGADEKGVKEWLQHDAESRKKLFGLLALQPQENVQVTGISASRGQLSLFAVATPSLLGGAPDDLKLLVASATLPDLKSALDRLQASAASEVDPDAFRDSYATSARTLTGLALGLLFVPIALILLPQLHAPAVELVTNRFTDKYTLVATAIVVCALAAIGAVLMRGSARLHTVLVPLLLMGGTGAMVVAPALIRQVNAEWDSSTPQRFQAKVLSGYVTSGRSSKQYYIWLTDWHSQRDHRELRVDSATYHRLRQGAEVVVSERQGYLGRAWISDLDSRGML